MDDNILAMSAGEPMSVALCAQYCEATKPGYPVFEVASFNSENMPCVAFDYK